MEEFYDFEESDTCKEWECHEFPTQEEVEELQKEMEEHAKLIAWEKLRDCEEERIYRELLAWEEEMLMSQNPELDLDQELDPHHPYDDLFHEEEDFDS